MCTDAGKICCPSRLRPRPAALVMGKKQADVTVKADSMIQSKTIMNMGTMNHSRASLLTSDDDYCNDLITQKGKELVSNEGISCIRVCGKKRKGLLQNLDQLNVIHIKNGMVKEKQKRMMQNDLLNKSHSSSEDVSCQNNCINTDDDSVRKRLRSGRSSIRQNQHAACRTTSRTSEDYQGADFTDCSAENSNISCNFSASSLISEGFVFDGTSHSSCESGRGTLGPEDGLQDLDMLSESWDNFNSIRSVEISG